MKALVLPSAEYLRECFDYDPSTGVLTWRFRPASHFSNNRSRKSFISQFACKPVGWADRKGYLRVRLNGKVYSVHRIVWKLVHGTEPPAELDHFDRDRTNNRIKNLLTTTRSGNCLNTGRRTDNSSGIKGIDWFKTANKWRARTTVNGRAVHVGLFSNIKDAYVALMLVRAEHHGPYTAVPPEHRHKLDAFLLSLAEQAIRHGKREIPGFEIREEKTAV